MTRRAPDRWKPRDEWTVDEVLEHDRTGHRPETAQYRQAVADAHRAFGLEPPDVPLDEKSVEDWTAQEHFDRMTDPDRRR